MTLAETLTMIAEHAPSLRKNGVSKVAVDGVSFELLPAEPDPSPAAASAGAGDSEHDQDPDPLHDEWTFGGRKVPGRQASREEE